MAEASAATPIHVVPVVLYRSGGACLRHARLPRLVRCLHTFWVMGRLYTHDGIRRSIVVAALASAMPGFFRHDTCVLQLSTFRLNDSHYPLHETCHWHRTQIFVRA